MKSSVFRRPEKLFIIPLYFADKHDIIHNKSKSYEVQLRSTAKN